MTATSYPLARCQPDFVAGQPFDGPRNDAIGDEVPPGPLGRVRHGVMHTKQRLLRLIEIPVEMLRPTAGPGMPRHKRRIEQPDTRHVPVRNLQFPEPAAADVADLDRVGPAERAQLPRPDGHPVAPLRPEARVEGGHAVDLIFDRRPVHFSGGSEPKFVCDRAANDWRGAAVATAGAARPERAKSMRPDPRS